VVAGRIDNGASLKIAATNGKVVDAVTHAVVWTNDNGFGYRLRLARFPGELRQFHAHAREEILIFHGRFYRLRIFRCKTA
jgi:hypothetical protein